jgi:hypothetical protein
LARKFETLPHRLVLSNADIRFRDLRGKALIEFCHRYAMSSFFNFIGILIFLFLVIHLLAQLFLIVFYARVQKKTAYIYLLMIMGSFGSAIHAIYIIYAFTDIETPYFHWIIAVFGDAVGFCVILAESLVLEIFIPGSKGVLTKERIRLYQIAAIGFFIIGLIPLVWALPYLGTRFPEPLYSIWQRFSPIFFAVVMIIEFIVTRYVLFRITALLTQGVGSGEHQCDRVGLRRLYWVRIFSF